MNVRIIRLRPPICQVYVLLANHYKMLAYLKQHEQYGKINTNRERMRTNSCSEVEYFTMETT